jgi:hypothetical protein
MVIHEGNIWKKSDWIWPTGSENTVNQYVEFRQEFETGEVACGARLLISVVGNFAAWVNGQLVGTGQFTDYPESRTFSTMDVAEILRRGCNVLAVLVHCPCIDHFSHIQSSGGMIFLIRNGEDIVVSGPQTQTRFSPAYRQGQMPKITPQMGFVFEYDAVKDDGWREVDYAWGHGWQKPLVRNYDVPLPRPLPMLELRPRTSHRIVAQGVFKREAPGAKTVAELMQSDFLSARRDCEIFSDLKVGDEPIDRPLTISEQCFTETGAYVVIDLGREECGLIDLDLAASDGTVVDIAVGEHLEDLRVRANIDGRNFASRYICRQGRQQFTHYANRYAGRYLELHISSTADPVTLYYSGLIPTEYPLTVRGDFVTSDNQMNTIYQVSRRTLHLCMHEHYEDCPWREQALYANDSRNQALAGYYTFGEYDFARVSWDLLGRGLKADGYLEMCAPANISITIPSFTMTWFLSLDDYLLFTGDVNFIHRYMPQLQQMLEGYLTTLEDNLLPCPVGKRFWHFYDWAEGLIAIDMVPKGGLKSNRFDAPLNLFFILALRAGARISQYMGQKTVADKFRSQAALIARAVHERFWCDRMHAYQTYSGEQGIDHHYAELTQSLAIIAQICSPDQADRLRRRLLDPDNGWIKTTLSQSFYKFQAILQDQEHLGQRVFENIDRDWSLMLHSGATSFWETLKGQFDFNYAGSLCHGWSAIPAYFYSAYLLGIHPLSPGFETFLVEPLRGTVPKASGKIPTPHGIIEVRLEQQGEKLYCDLTHPAGIKPVFKSFKPEDQIEVHLSEPDNSNTDRFGHIAADESEPAGPSFLVENFQTNQKKHNNLPGIINHRSMRQKVHFPR